MGRTLGRGFRSAPRGIERGDDRLVDGGELRAEPREHARPDAFALADEPEQNMLGPDVVVAELECLAQRELEDLLRPRRERDVTRWCSSPAAHDLFNLRAHI